MILNLPNEFPLNELEEFVFGDVEAKVDDLLENPICFCRISPIDEFLKGKKSIVAGERGAGKTALFRLISSNKLQFRKHKNQEHIIIPIEEELQYKLIRDQIIPSIKTYIKDDTLNYRIVWEFFIIYRILMKLKEVFSDILPQTINKAVNDFEEIFGSRKKVSLIQLFSSLKHTIGLKIENAYTGDIKDIGPYYSVEPKNTNPSDEKKDIIIPKFDIDLYKKEIHSFLENRKATCFILIDKLDEFVIKDDYDIQRLTLQGLLECERSYHGFKNIKLKIFLRNDLFKRLDFEKLGYEKIASRKIDLIWTDEDIRRFIARRITYNLFKILKLDLFEITIDENNLYRLDEKSVDLNEVEDGKKGDEQQSMSFAEKVFNKMFMKSKDQDKREMRRINFKDEINRQIITSIFPRKVKHLTTSGQAEQIDIFNFLETHFCLNTGNTTPRIIIMFLEKCLDYVKEYYKSNPDTNVKLDENKEYPLIIRDKIVTAYSNFQNDIWDTFTETSSKWKSWFNRLRAKKGNKFSFSYKDIQKILKIETSEDSELNQFLAFLNHIGHIQCSNPNLVHSERKYILPILFRGLSQKNRKAKR